MSAVNLSSQIIQDLYQSGQFNIIIMVIMFITWDRRIDATYIALNQTNPTLTPSAKYLGFWINYNNMMVNYH